MTEDLKPDKKPTPEGKPVSEVRPAPGVENVPTFDQLPPVGYEKARKREIEELCKEHKMTPEQLARYEKMAEEEG